MISGVIGGVIQCACDQRMFAVWQRDLTGSWTTSVFTDGVLIPNGQEDCDLAVRAYWQCNVAMTPVTVVGVEGEKSPR